MSKNIIELEYCDNLFKDCGCVDDVFDCFVLKLKFAGKPAYIYFVFQEGNYDLSFGHSFKEDVLKKEINCNFTNYVKSLDENGFVCLNDVQDKIFTKYNEMTSSYRNRKYTDLSNYAAKKGEKYFVIVSFLSKMKRLMSEFMFEFENVTTDKEVVLQSFFKFYEKEKNFFNKYMSVDRESFEKISDMLAKTDPIIKFGRNTLEKEIIELNPPNHNRKLRKI